MQIISKIEKEITNYETGQVPLSEGVNFSQYKLVKRIMIYANQTYPTGKLDSQKNYKYWFDINTSRINAEVKNIDFDTKDIEIYSDQTADATAVFLLNAALREYLRNSGQGEEINNTIEEGVGWGNVVFKKIKGGYERVDLKNFIVTNQLARTLDETTVIERHNLTQSQLREKAGVWDNVEKLIDQSTKKDLSATPTSQSVSGETPYYEVYERNGEVSEKDLFEAQGKEKGDEKKYLLAKIVCSGLGKDKKANKLILFAEKISEMPYIEYHRGRYNGRWWRQGLYELLLEIQTRANEIGNQIARGLAWASKKVFFSPDQLIAQNIMTDLKNGKGD